MTEPRRPATLMATLLDPGTANRRVDRCFVSSDKSRDLVADIAKRAETVTALFCDKGAASADGFDPLTSVHARRSVASSGTAERGGVQRVRVWLRIDGLRRSKLKLAAKYGNQTCQAILATAVDAFMIECAAIPDAAAASVALIAKGAARRAPNGRRHKIAIWVDLEQRERIRDMVARLGQTIQALLQAALDETLDRMARSERAMCHPSAATTDTSGTLVAFPAIDLVPTANADPVGTEVISFKRAAQARPLAPGVAMITKRAHGAKW
jgi:hypothetical protein